MLFIDVLTLLMYAGKSNRYEMNYSVLFFLVNLNSTHAGFCGYQFFRCFHSKVCDLFSFNDDSHVFKTGWINDALQMMSIKSWKYIVRLNLATFYHQIISTSTLVYFQPFTMYICFCCDITTVFGGSFCCCYCCCCCCCCFSSIALADVQFVVVCAAISLYLD